MNHQEAIDLLLRLVFTLILVKVLNCIVGEI